MFNQHKIKLQYVLLSLVSLLVITAAVPCSAATAPNITYKSGSSSPYSSANLEYTTNGSYSWTVPDRVTQIKVTTVGAGGGSSNSTSKSMVNPNAVSGGGTTTLNYGGGGGGAVTENVTISVTPGKVVTINVGSPSKVTDNGKAYAISNAGGKGTTTSGGAAGGTGGGKGGAPTSTTAGNGKYGKGGAAYSYINGRGNKTNYGGGGGSWGDGGYCTAGIRPGLSGTVSPGLGGGGANGSGGSGGVFISYALDPVVAVTGISISKSTLSLNPGGSATLTATVSPSNATNKAVTWSSNNTSVATVDSSGKVTAKTNGTAVITVKSSANANATASCTVTVTTPTTGVTVSLESVSLNVGNTKQLTATISPSTASNKSVTWTSSNSAVATVNSSGLVTAKGNGTATITVKSAANSSVSDTCTVTVTTPASGITVTPESVTLNIGNTRQLTAAVAPSTASNKSVTWSSSDGGVASVSSSGLVTAKSNGTATITAKTASGGYTDTSKITVKTPVSGVSLSSTSLTINKGGTSQLTATVNPSTASNKNVAWSTSHDKVASVSQTGLVTAVGGGTADITVTTEDGSYSAQCKVTVNVPVTGVRFNDTTSSVGTDTTTQLLYTVEPADASDKKVTWHSSNTAVAMIDEDTGVITPIAPGGTEITVTTVDGNYSAATLLVVTTSFDQVPVKFETESGNCPDYATIYYKSGGSLIKYPGVLIGSYGDIEAYVPVSASDYVLGISFVNTLIAEVPISAETGEISGPLNLIEGDFNGDNVIDGTDYAILVQRSHYGGGSSEYGLTGDINYDGVIDERDRLLFGGPVAYTGGSRFMQKGFDINTAEPETVGALSLNSADEVSIVPAQSIIRTVRTGDGRYEVSLGEVTEPVTMLQIALDGNITETSAAAPEGFEVIGAYTEDGRSVVAIGSTRKDGCVIPANVPLVTVKASETPSVKYGPHETVMQKIAEAGVEVVSLEASGQGSVESKEFYGSSSGGCNTGIGMLGLLAALPVIFSYKRRIR